MQFGIHKKLSALLLVGMTLFAASCFKDLDTVPLDKDLTTAANAYDSPEAYKQVLAKLYAGLAVSGQQGPAGLPDISGIDEGFSTYLRQLFNVQELTTDLAVIAWNDGTIQDLHQQDWDANNEFITAMYNRIFYQISLTNEYLRETTDDKLSSRGVSGTLRDDIARYRAEARFLRALSYWHALDLFRNVPFVTENDAVGAFFPRQTNANELFSYVESELKAIEGTLAAPRTNEYGRADQAAAWTVLAKLYLNAQVYIGQNRYTDAVTYSKKVIDAGYQLDPSYEHLFQADNHTSPEIIFSVNFDGTRTQTYGGTTYFVHAPVGGSMSPADFGIDGGWGGIRTTSAFVSKFPATGGSVIVSPNPGSSDSYTKIYVPGAYQGWDPATARQLASRNNDNTFEGYIYFADANSEFKFTQGPNWDVNWGDTGADGTLEPGGDNLKVAEAGLYRITVDLNANTYTLLKTNWGIIGDATPTGWDSDTDLAYDAADNSLAISIDLTAASIKFRANDDWGLNYGDDGPDGILEAGGANIAIPSAGRYTVKLFLDHPDYTYSIERSSFDGRALFYTDGQTLEITDISQFTEGYAMTKWKNVTSAGAAGSHPTFVDTDFPMFRLADVYLMYAEAVLRGGTGGSLGDAVNYVNLVRARAYGGPAGNITENQLTLDFILDERARELYWEAQRRTDLVRFDRFSDGPYVWPWKGGVPDGRATESFRDVFPIPSSDIGANPNLQQNTGY